MPAEAWKPAMKKLPTPKTFVSKASSRYTGELNRRLAVAMVQGLRVARQQALRARLQEVREDGAIGTSTSAPSRPGIPGLVEVSQSCPIRTPVARARRHIENDEAFGGMRNPLKAVDELGSRAKSEHLRRLTLKLFRDHPAAMASMLKALGAPQGAFD